MKNIRLRAPRLVGRALRQPAEGVIQVDDATADRLVEEEAADLVDAPVLPSEDPETATTDGAPAGSEDDDLEEHTVAELTDLAASEGVDLSGVTKKADIIAAIRAHRATPAE